MTHKNSNNHAKREGPLVLGPQKAAGIIGHELTAHRRRCMLRPNTETGVYTVQRNVSRYNISSELIFVVFNLQQLFISDRYGVDFDLFFRRCFLDYIDNLLPLKVMCGFMLRFRGLIIVLRPMRYRKSTPSSRLTIKYENLKKYNTSLIAFLIVDCG